MTTDTMPVGLVPRVSQYNIPQYYIPCSTLVLTSAACCVLQEGLCGPSGQNRSVECPGGTGYAGLPRPPPVRQPRAEPLWRLHPVTPRKAHPTLLAPSASNIHSIGCRGACHPRRVQRTAPTHIQAFKLCLQLPVLPAENMSCVQYQQVAARGGLRQATSHATVITVI